MGARRRGGVPAARGAVTSVKNPRTGRIVADSYGEIILDDNIKAPADCKILIRT